MAGLTSLMIHDVKSIELSSFRPWNSNSRTLKITTDDGVFELCVFGRTEGLAAVPQASDYRTSFSENGTFELSEAAE